MVEAFLETLIKGIQHLGWSSSKKIAEHTDWAVEEIESSLSKLAKDNRILLRKKGRGFQYGPLDNESLTSIANSDKSNAFNDVLAPNELAEGSAIQWDSQTMKIPAGQRIPQSELSYLEPATHRKIDIIEAANVILAELPRHEFFGKIERNVYSLSEIIERLVERWGYLKSHAHEAVITAIQQKKTIVHMQHRYMIANWVCFLYRPKDDLLPEPPTNQEIADRSWITTNAQLGTATANN
jgi:hypothetical protein